MKALICKHPLISFFVLTYTIMFGVVFGNIYLNPGQPMQPWSLVWFFSIFSPSISALVISGITGGVAEIKRLLYGFTRWKVHFGWYFAALFLLLGPLAIAMIYFALGNPPVGLRPGVTIPGLLGTILFVFISGLIAEEAGWRGFALPRLQEKYNALVSSLILGVIFIYKPKYFSKKPVTELPFTKE